MKRKIMCFISMVLAIIGISIINSLFNEQTDTYTAKILSYEKNNSYIEYPQISGLKDKKKQDAINKILENQVLYGAKNYMGETFVDFSEPNYNYKYRTSIGWTNDKIASFHYSFDGYGEVKVKGGVQRNTSRNYGVTIDMKTGKKIELWDFMEIDERLINSDDGTNIETDYTSVTLPIYHNFKDAFMVYGSEKEEDILHWCSVEETIEELKNKAGETNWYIDKNKNIVFYCNNNCVKIPYTKISDAIYPKYLDLLKE